MMAKPMKTLELHYPTNPFFNNQLYVLLIFRYFFRDKILKNRPFPSSLVPLFQNEFKCETIPMKMSSAFSFIFMQIKFIFIRIVSHLDSL